MLEGISDASEFVQYRKMDVGFRGLSKPQKLYYCVWALNDYLQGGGLVDYFLSSTGRLAHLTRKALRVLGATQTEQILCRAMSILGGEGPSQTCSTSQ